MLARPGTQEVRYLATAAPATEPVSVDDVKMHRRIDAEDTSQDALISILIGAAREYAEAYTGRSFITRSWRAVLDQFPGPVVPPIPALAAQPWQPLPPSSAEIWLAHGPVVSVDALKYLDPNGVQQTLDPSQYVLDTSGPLARLAPSGTNTWPATLWQIGCVTVDFTAGYGSTASAVPAQFRNWMLVRIGTLYENREEVAVMQRGKIEAVPFLDTLLDLHKVPVL